MGKNNLTRPSRDLLLEWWKDFSQEGAISTVQFLHTQWWRCYSSDTSSAFIFYFILKVTCFVRFGLPSKWAAVDEPLWSSSLWLGGYREEREIMTARRGANWRDGSSQLDWRASRFPSSPLFFSFLLRGKIFSFRAGLSSYAWNERQRYNWMACSASETK